MERFRITLGVSAASPEEIDQLLDELAGFQCPGSAVITDVTVTEHIIVTEKS